MGGVARTTLHLWWRKFRQCGLAALVDNRGRDPNRPDAHEHFYRELRRRLLAGSRASVAAAYRAAVARAAQYGWAVPSYKAAQRHVAARKRQASSAGTASGSFARTCG